MTEQESSAAPAEPAKKRGVGKIIFSVLGVIVVVAIIAVVKFGAGEVLAFITGDTAKAEVGDCITQTKNTSDQNAEDMKIVDCADPEAAFEVVGVVENKTDTESKTACIDFASAESYLFMWEGEKTETTKGRVICLAPIAT